MKAGLERLPDDVCLALLDNVGPLENWIAFASTCKRFSTWFSQRFFWIRALQATKAQRPIACALHYDLAKCTLPELQDIASRSLRLRRTWSLPRPPPIPGPCTVVDLGSQGLDVIFQVPGTQLYVLHSTLGGYIACWDMAVGREVAPRVQAPMRLVDVSGGVNEPGRFSMATLMEDISPRQTYLSIVTIEYELETGDVVAFPSYNVKLSYSFHLNLDAHHVCDAYRDVFLTEDVVGVMMSPTYDGDVDDSGGWLQALLYNRDTGAHAIIKAEKREDGIDPGSWLSGSMASASIMIGKEFYYLMEDGTSLMMTQCKGIVPGVDVTGTRTLPFQVGFEEAKVPEPPQDATPPVGIVCHEHRDSEGILNTNPFYGVPIVSVRSTSTERWVPKEGPVDLEGAVEGDSQVPGADLGQASNEDQMPDGETGQQSGEPSQDAGTEEDDTPNNLSDSEENLDDDESQRSDSPGIDWAKTHDLVEDNTLEVEFWTVHEGIPPRQPWRPDLEGEDDVEEGSRIYFASNKPISIPGRIHEGENAAWRLFLIPHSGRILIALVDTKESSTPLLYLFKFEPETGKTTAHILEVPEEVSWEKLRGFSLDDHCGTLSCLDRDGRMCIVRYV